MTGAPAVEDIVKSEYEHGFTTEIESDTLPPGLDEEVVRAISKRKGEPEFMTEQRLKAYRHWLTMREPEWAAVDYPRIDFQSISYYSAPKRPEDMPKSLDEIDPALLETYNKLGIPIEEQKALAGIAVDAVFDSVSVATTFRATLAEAGVIFCSISEALHEYPELVKQYLGTVVPYTDNFYACAQRRRVQRRHLRLCTQGRALPDGAFDLFPHQRGQHRPVRAHPDHRRCRQLCQLSRRLHRAPARRKPAPRRRGRAGRDGRRRDQIFDGAELVSGRCRGARRHLQLRHQARRLPRRALQDLLDPGRDRIGHHLEISELHPARRRIRRRVLLGRRDQGYVSRPIPAPR
jgi:hypothetical protein